MVRVARVHLSGLLGQMVPGGTWEGAGSTVGEVLKNLIAAHPGLGPRLLDAQGEVHRHVLLFVDQDHIGRLGGLAAPVRPDSEVEILQALAGG